MQSKEDICKGGDRRRGFEGQGGTLEGEGNALFMVFFLRAVTVNIISEFYFHRAASFRFIP